MEGQDIWMFFLNFGVLGVGVFAFFRYGVPYLDNKYKEWEARVDKINNDWADKYNETIKSHREEMSRIAEQSNETHLLSVKAITENSKILQTLNAETNYLRESNIEMKQLLSRINENLRKYNNLNIDD